MAGSRSSMSPQSHALAWMEIVCCTHAIPQEIGSLCTWRTFHLFTRSLLSAFPLPRERKLYIVYSVFIGRSCASEQGTNLCLERKHQSFLTVGNHPCYPATVICILRIVCCSGICDVFRPACFYDFPLLNLWHSCRLRIDEDKACKMLKLNFYLHMSQTHHKMKNHLSPSHIGTTLPSKKGCTNGKV